MELAEAKKGVDLSDDEVELMITTFMYADDFQTIWKCLVETRSS